MYFAWHRLVPVHRGAIRDYLRAFGTKPADRYFRGDCAESPEKFWQLHGSGSTTTRANGA